MRVEIDGRPPTVAALQHRALANYGHFTSFQVRDSKVRGAGDGEQCAVRVDVFRPPAAGDVSVRVTVRPPAEAPTAPQRLQTVRAYATVGWDRL